MVLRDLRTQTRPLHDALESHLDLLSPTLGPDQYLALLQRFHGFYAPIETRVAAYRDAPEGWLGGDRRKLPWLTDDLKALGMTANAIECLPRCRELPDFSGPLRQLGCMYVLEGATLGGQVISRSVRLRLNGTGTTFFASYRERTGLMWRGFCARVERAGASDEAATTIVQSACETFKALSGWMTVKGVDP